MDDLPIENALIFTINPRDEIVPDGAASRDLGAGEHTDYGNVTILATDGVASLQVGD